MCKKGLFLPHTSARNEFFEFFGHFPEAQKLVEKVAFFLIQPGLDKFSTIAGGCQMENMVFRGNMGKNVLFLACRSVRNSFLKFLVHVLEP